MPQLEQVGALFGYHPDGWTHNRSEHAIELPNGSMFWLRSADNPESLLGADLAWIWGDEVGLWKRDAYRYLLGRLRQPGYPHQLFCTYTPKGRTWAYDELATAREGLEVYRSSSLDNPFLDEDFRERLSREYGEGTQWWRQEVLGEFVSFEGLIYRFDAEQHVGTPPSRFVTHVAGVDWGFENPGVILVIGLNPDNEAWVLEEIVQQRRGIGWWVDTARGLLDRYPIRSYACDPSQPANIAELQAAGLPAIGAENAVLPGIMAVSGRIDDGKLRIAEQCTHTIGEIQGYCWKQQRDGTARPDEPDKIHDHAMDALRYGIMALDAPARQPREQHLTIEHVAPAFKPIRIGAARL